MGLQSPSSAATTLASLDAAGIVIVLEDEGWFIKSYQQLAGPYATAEAALEATDFWIAKPDTRQVGGDQPKYHD